MTGDPNQESRSPIFGEDSNHLSQNPEWNRFAATGNSFYMQSNFPFCANYGPAPVTFPIHSNSKNGNFFGPMYNYQANSTIAFTPTSNTTCLPSSSNFQYANSSRIDRLSIKRKTECHSMGNKSKQLITEERMAEHLSKLHISSETPINYENEKDLTKRLYMCEEMKKLQTDTAILPASLVSQFQKPCTALVLWQPPQNLLPLPPIAVQPEDGQPVEESIDNNNEEEVPDQNLMDLM